MSHQDDRRTKQSSTFLAGSTPTFLSRACLNTSPSERHSLPMRLLAASLGQSARFEGRLRLLQGLSSPRRRQAKQVRGILYGANLAVLSNARWRLTHLMGTNRHRCHLALRTSTSRQCAETIDLGLWLARAWPTFPRSYRDLNYYVFGELAHWRAIIMCQPLCSLLERHESRIAGFAAHCGQEQRFSSVFFCNAHTDLTTPNAVTLIKVLA